MTSLDPRIHAYRPDLAAEELKGKVDAPSFAPGRGYQVRTARAPLHTAPDFQAPLLTELLMGERVTIYEEREGWSWGQAASDHYVGYLPTASLRKEIHETTHRVAVLRTFIFPEADIKSPPLIALSLNAHLTIINQDEKFSTCLEGGYIATCHLKKKDIFAPDFVAVAEMFQGTPYLWGGRQSSGLDCSALVQLSLEASGKKAPRDSDMQQDVLGEALGKPDDFASLKRGDLVFWEGHVGLMVDETRLIHANAYHMMVKTEPLAKAVDRIKKEGNEVTALKRMTAG